MVTASIVYILLYDSILFFRQVSIIDFLTDTEWTPVFDNPRFGIMTLVSGTLMTTFIGLVVAVPAGTILAIYLSEFAQSAHARDRSSRSWSFWPACPPSPSATSPCFS